MSDVLDKLKHLSILFTCLITLLNASSQIDNNLASQKVNTIVFVHGLGGWGPDEFLGFPYWSHLDLFQQRGFNTVVPSLGKFTSNWDRACEMYAQLKGTIVDYGVCHSEKFRHARFGKNYSDKKLLPSDQGSEKIHLVGHSMGAQTMLLFEKILHEGSGCERDTSPFFTRHRSNKNWIKSITTISGTIQGTTFVDINGDDFSNFVRDLHVGLAGLTDNSTLYNIDLSYWGIEKFKSESFDDYWTRVEKSGIISPSNEDFSMFDLSTKGAEKINAFGEKTYPNTHYMSIRTSKTHPTKKCHFFFFCGKTYETPSIFMTPFLRDPSKIIGYYSDDVDMKNDGLVPVNRQLCPFDDHSMCVEYRGDETPHGSGASNGTLWLPGSWSYLDFPDLDHIEVILRPRMLGKFSHQFRLFDELASRLTDISNGEDRMPRKSKLPEFVGRDYGLIVIVGSILIGCLMKCIGRNGSLKRDDLTEELMSEV